MPSLVSLDSPGQGNSVAAKLDKAREVELSDAAGDHLTNLDRRELILRLQSTVQGFAKSAYLNNKVHTALEQIQLVDAVQEARLDSRNLNAASVAIAKKFHDAKDAIRIEKGQVQKHSYYLKRATLPNKADIDLKYWGKVVEWHAGANVKRDKLVPMYAVTEGAPNFLIDFTCCSDAFDSSFCTAALVRKVPENKKNINKDDEGSTDKLDTADKADKDDDIAAPPKKQNKHKSLVPLVATHEVVWIPESIKMKVCANTEGSKRCMVAKDHRQPSCIL